MKKNLLEKKISMIKEVASTIISSDNPDAITNLILNLALSYTKAKNGSILILDHKGNLIVKAAKGMDSELIPALSVRLGEKICGRVAKEKTIMLVKNIKRDKRFRKPGNGKYESNSFICCPIMKKDKLLGVINVTDKVDGTPFTEDEADIIDILGNQTAIALENAYLMSELRSKARELDERNKTLIDSDKLKTEFVARMTHELRTPLNSINGAIYYLKEKKASRSEQGEFIEIISAETNKLINLLDGLLNFSNIEKEELLLSRKVINLMDIVHEATESKIVKEALVNKKLSLKISGPESLSDIVGEKIRLVQAFIHLIEGITKYTNAGDAVELTLTDKKKAIKVELLVRGRAIPDDVLSFIFDERSVWSGMDDKENKLKFYLAKMTLELHKGTISVSNTTKGISMTITFPKSQREYIGVEIDELMNLFLSFISESMNLRTCSLMLTDELSRELIIRSAFGIDEDIIRKTRLKIGEKIAGTVAAENRPLLIEDIESDPKFRRKSRPQYNTKSLLCIPVVVKKRVAGVLNFNNKASGEAFNKKDLYLAMAITDRISHIIDIVQRGDLVDSDFKTMVKGLETLLNATRQYKKKKGNLADLVFKIMQRMGRSEDEIKLALYASELYDLGLTQIDESILMKTDDLSPIERKIIKTHPFPGAGLIEHIEADNSVKKIILHHHERYDGSGYPDGLKGDEIPFTSRILAIVDTYSAMTSDRPYRKAFSHKRALAQIKAAGGTLFDPSVVDAFVHIA